MWRLTVGLVLTVISGAEVRSICLEDRVGLNAYTRQAFEVEWRKLVQYEQLALSMVPCSSPAVSLVVSAHPPARYAHALGLAHHNGGRVFPELRIYTRPVLRLLGEQASAVQLGRALARVAAHELGHYLLQRLHHEKDGLMRTSFASAQLLAKH